MPGVRTSGCCCRCLLVSSCIGYDGSIGGSGNERQIQITLGNIPAGCGTGFNGVPVILDFVNFGTASGACYYHWGLDDPFGLGVNHSITCLLGANDATGEVVLRVHYCAPFALSNSQRFALHEGFGTLGISPTCTFGTSNPELFGTAIDIGDFCNGSVIRVNDLESGCTDATSYADVELLP